jgi:hypothetical protein
MAVNWRTEGDLVDEREPVVDVSQSEFWSSESYQAAKAWMPFLHEYYFPLVVSGTPSLKSQFLQRIASTRPDVIVLEHPWLWPLIRHLPEVKSSTIRVVYSSQNVEAPLKRRIVEDAHVAVSEDVLNDVEAMERDLVNSAWTTVACTQADADVFSSWGARRVVIGNNGTVIKAWDDLVGVLPPPLATKDQFVFSVGAYYAPNVSGFFKYVAPALWRLQPHTRVVIAGRMCELIDEQIRRSPIEKYKASRLVSLGMIEETTLDALIANTRAILLPIEYGGGSNLKTAEALMSGSPIIATRHAFRGFPSYETLTRVTIADTPMEFDGAIHRALSAPVARHDNTPVPHELLWESTLSLFIKLMQSIAEPARELAALAQ